MINLSLWDRCVQFHGHSCGGLAIGYQVACYAEQLFPSEKNLVCIAENNSCSIDGIQIGLGCTVGNGKLMFHLTGKQAYSLYDCTAGESVRLLLKDIPEGMTKEEAFLYYRDSHPEDLFRILPVKNQPPEILPSRENSACAVCGELTGEQYLRIFCGKPVCLDCFHHSNRFAV